MHARIAAASLLVLGWALSPAPLLARRGCLFVMGYGETISHIADADLSGDPELEAELSLDDSALGFRYEYVSFFFLDVWTGGGGVVLYDQSADDYYALSPEQLRELTGRGPDDYSKPLLYRIPLGWIVFGGLGLVFAAGTWLKMRELP
ncbi:MAG: hypothetical protein RLP09_32165 [Sandaracinaceae bacterium]